MTPHHPCDWHHIAEQLSKEMDSERVLELAEELNRVLGEREENSRREHDRGNQPKSFWAAA